jgi:two-component system, cell cycle response regulator DivK
MSAVLLVDPYPDSREMYAEFLRHSGIDAVAVDNGIDALAHARHVDVIVTGILLRGSMDGVELIRRLRRNGHTRPTPIIVLTACAFQPERERAERAGCNAFLPKPCLPDVLVAEVRRQLAFTQVLRLRAKDARVKTRRTQDRSAPELEDSRRVSVRKPRR